MTVVVAPSPTIDCDLPRPAIPPLPRCPFARLGLDAIASAGCIGFSPQKVSFPHGPGESLDAGISCRHIRIAQAQERHWPVCSHPDAPLPRPAEARRDLLGRRH